MKLKLLEAVEAAEQNKVLPHMKQVPLNIRYEEDIEDITPDDYIKTYRVGVSFSDQVCVTNHMITAADYDIREQMVKKMQHRIADYVYGDLREYMYQILSNPYDAEKVRELTNTMLNLSYGKDVPEENNVE